MQGLEVIPRMALTGSLSMRSLLYIRLDRPPVQAEIHFYKMGSGPVCAMDVPIYYKTCSGCAPRPAR